MSVVLESRKPRGFAGFQNLVKPWISQHSVLDKIDRLTFMNCHDCSSRRTVLAMNAGFQAITGKRKKLREKQGMGVGNAMKQ